MLDKVANERSNNSNRIQGSKYNKKESDRQVISIFGLIQDINASWYSN